MEKLFRLKKYGSNVRTELLAGITTFFTMAYIIFVNPNILSSTGMNWNGVFVATCLAAAVGTLIMSFLANLPYAQAPGMGLNAFFAYAVCASMGFAWQEALAMVFICGLISVTLTVTKVRKSLLLSIPRSIQNAIGGAIGLFIAYIGLKNAGILEFAGTAEGLTTGAAAVPRLVNFTDRGVQLALIGLLIMVVLMLLKIKGALFIGIIATTVIGIPMGIVDLSNIKWFDMSAVADVKEVAFAFFGNTGFSSMFGDPTRIFLAITAIIAFSLTDIFDTIGTFIGTGRQSGIFTDEDEKHLREGGQLSTRLERGLLADMIATVCGSLFGTSNVTTYVESATGISAGGRTGLTSLTTGILLLLCIPFASVVGIVPAQATAPVLILVGVLMMASFMHIRWDSFEEALPVFFTVVIMAFGYSISYGIAAGFIFYCIAKICTGKIKEIHPLLGGAALFFILNFVLQAVTA